MRYQQDLQVAIRERLRRLHGAHWEDLFYTVRLVRDWIAGQPSLAAIWQQPRAPNPSSISTHG